MVVGFDKVGRFGEIFPTLQRLGYKIGFSPQVEVGHPRSHALWHDEKHIHWHAIADLKVRQPWGSLTC